MRLKKKVAIVTGGSQGIGYSICSRFALEGASVVIAARDSEKGKKASEALQKAEGRVIFIKTDVTNSNEVTSLVRSTVDKFGKLDILVNNAGIRPTTPFAEIPHDEWGRVIRVNLTSVFLCSQAAIPYLEKQGGKIINISSIAGITCAPNRAAYSASKGAIIVLTKAMAVELASKGITVNCVAPGATLTSLTNRYLTDNDDDSTAMRQRWRSAIPLGRPAKPEDQAGAVLFLASEDADYITGVTLPVDGGWLASR